MKCRVASSPFLRRLLPLGVVFILPGCAADRPEEPAPEPAAEESAYGVLPLPERPGSGFFLHEIDNLLRFWSNARLTARTDEDWRRIHGIEQQMNQEVWKHRTELIDILASGPPRQREVAAAALGFAGVPEALGPLLNALSDREPEVVEKALLGVGVLADPATPPGPIVFQLRSNPAPRARGNAAFALYRIVAGGAGGEEIAAAARDGLRDPEWSVQTQCAGILGRLGDPAAIASLGLLLLSESSTPCHAAAVALHRIARADPSRRAEVGRTLVEALPRVEAAHQELVLAELVDLAGQNHGNDLDAWREWAHGLE
ncbi:MAG: HEAT repeat domain-containing protein [Planctomycetota bacterium]